MFPVFLHTFYAMTCMCVCHCRFWQCGKVISAYLFRIHAENKTINMNQISPQTFCVPTGLLEHDHSLWRGVNRQGAGPLHRAVGPARHAVTSSGVGEPKTLRRIQRPHKPVERDNLT